MKRFNKTAVALATAGAMTLAIVPNASAQNFDPQPPEFGGAGDPATSLDELFNDENAEGNPGARAEDSENDLKPSDLPEGGVAGEQPGTYVEGNGIDNSNELPTTAVFPPTTTSTTPSSDTPTSPTTTTKVGNIDPEKLKKALIGVAATAGVLTIAGIVYKVVKNSKGEPVLVPEDRADQAPTAADEAKTQELLENNAAEIAAQTGVADATTGDAAAADRGVGAATGNNTIAKGLVGLLIASIMGAAAFAFGRRRLV